MRELLSKKQKRQLELLEILFKTKGWFHIAELAEQLHCTERSVKEDLSSIKSSFKDLLFQSSTNGVRLMDTEDSDIEMVHHYFFKQSTNFAILEFIFFNEGSSADSLCQEFFISTSSLYRITNHINKILRQRYNFQIALNPLQLAGDEIDIRYFFTQYFSEKYYFLDWPFENMSPEPISDLVKFIYKQTDFLMNFSTFQILRLFLMTSLYRIKFNHFLPLEKNQESQEAFAHYLTANKFQKIIEEFKRHYKIELNQRIFDQLFISYSQQYFFPNQDNFKTAVAEDDYVHQSYQLLKTFMQEIADKYQFEMKDKEKVIWHLHNMAHLSRQELFSDAVLFDQKGETINNFKNIFPNLFSDVKKKLEDYSQQLELPHRDSNINYLAYAFITHSDRLLLNLIQNQPRLKVLVISNFDKYHAQSISDTLSYYCSNNFEFYNIEDSEISIEHLETSPYDIIISNFIIPTIDKKRILYSNNINIIELISKLNAMMFIESNE